MAAIAVVVLASLAIAGGAGVGSDGSESARSRDDVSIDVPAPDPASPVEVLSATENEIGDHSRLLRLISVLGVMVVVACNWRRRCQSDRWLTVAISGRAPNSTRGPPALA